MDLFEKIKNILSIENVNSSKKENTGNIQKFREDNKIFYESGIIREIFVSEEYCICSIAEAAYVLFCYVITEGDYAGLMLHPTLMKMFAESKRKFESYIVRLDKQSRYDNLFVLGKAKLQELKEIKEKYSIQQSDSIDHQLEAQIRAKYPQ